MSSSLIKKTMVWVGIAIIALTTTSIGESRTTHGMTRENWFGKVEVLVGEEKIEDAIIGLSSLLSKHPDEWAALKQRGQLFMFQERYKMAVQDFSKYLIKFSEDKSALVNRAHCYSKLNDFHRSILDYSKLIELYPGDYKFYLQRGILLYYLADFNEALENFEKALNLNGECHIAVEYTEKIHKTLLIDK